ncbi:uncharacterized protein LOC113276289 [Papaver somniferum]|uniref:uncharacterized protein LOC113276289 n=1 Tax=Papaver somniferum TaxID=3469 RepID=UPI000E702A6C|nr:uncharacterized protein LOC113276289 [Papaver somniferum]
MGGNSMRSFPPTFVKNSSIDMNMNEVISFSNPYTWCNRRYKNPNELILEKLDRAFMNDKWVSVLPQTRVTNLGRIYSDHCPILIKCFHWVKSLNVPYKFFKCWQLDPNFKEVLTNSWSKRVVGSPTYVVVNKLKNVKIELCNWNINSFGHINTTIKKLNTESERLQTLPYSAQTGQYILNYSRKLDYWYEIEHSFYKQKSRINYITQYDRNTHFFHNKVNLRKMYNTIHTIKDDKGNWLEEREQIVHPISQHFKRISTTSNPSLENIEEALKYVNLIINDEMNHFLISIPTPQEIRDTVNSLASWSSPGIQISLSNAVYKIISKILTNRLKPFMDRLISPFQSAFVANRQIHDNVVISQEILHSFKRKRKSNKNDYLAIKLDLSKSFDRLEWSFIIAVFKKLGFSKEWCQMIKQCISRVSYSVLVNGSPGEIFYPSRSITQGDCLSPYICILCMEVLSQLLVKPNSEKLIQGFKFKTGSPSISHLFFSDDCMLFCKASVTYAKNLLKIIHTFSQASGFMSPPVPKCPSHGQYEYVHELLDAQTGNIKSSCADFGVMSDAVGAEAVALILAISWAEEMCLYKVVFISDCLQLVQHNNGVNTSNAWRSSDFLVQCRKKI